MVTVEVQGMRGVVGSFDNLYDEARKAVETEVDVALDNIVRNARARVPKRTGELSNTIRKERKPGELFGYVMAGYGKIKRRSNAVTRRKRRRKQAEDQSQPGIYAPVVEFGSKDPKHPRKPRPFLFPAWRLEKTPFDERLRKRLAEVAAKVMKGTAA